MALGLDPEICLTIEQIVLTTNSISMQMIPFTWNKATQDDLCP